MSNYFRLRRSLHRISPLILKTEKSECAHMFPFGLLDPERSTPWNLSVGRVQSADVLRSEEDDHVGGAGEGDAVDVPALLAQSVEHLLFSRKHSSSS